MDAVIASRIELGKDLTMEGIIAVLKLAFRQMNSVCDVSLDQDEELSESNATFFVLLEGMTNYNLTITLERS